jgi:hypothetical protein
MKKVVGFLLVVAIFATPVSPIVSVLSLGLGWLLWRQCSRALAAGQKLRPIRIPVQNQKGGAAGRN